ncbi:MAG: hypothetical protein Q9195_001680 [Heterodermia aff. obscurata]
MFGPLDLGPPSVLVRVELDGNACTIQSHTIQVNLPGLWRQHRRTIMRYGHLPMSTLLLPHGPGAKKALKIIFHHLCEADSLPHVSTAITNGLETALHRSCGLPMPGALSLADVFIPLAQLFHPRVFGCSSNIFKQMESFFLIHSEEILTGHNITLGFHFIALLDYMSLNGRSRPWDMTPVLACLVRAWDRIGARPRHLPPLSSTSKRILKELALQSRRRRQHIPPCPCIGGRPALTHRPHSHHGDFRPSAVVPGKAFRTEDLLQFCIEYPELIDCHLPGYKNGGLEDEMSLSGGGEIILVEAGNPHGFWGEGMYADLAENPWLEPGFVRPRLC